ncbi:hypothetical protein TSMEX_003563 [Taenia solium]|eukprot:TsM_001170600 transcript=TsM_001170600 gene=TsM_001170600
MNESEVTKYSHSELKPNALIWIIQSLRYELPVHHQIDNYHSGTGSCDRLGFFQQSFIDLATWLCSTHQHNIDPGKNEGKAIAVLENIQFQRLFLTLNFDFYLGDFSRHRKRVNCKFHPHMATAEASLFKAPSRNDGDERTTIFIRSTRNAYTWDRRPDLCLTRSLHT